MHGFNNFPDVLYLPLYLSNEALFFSLYFTCWDTIYRASNNKRFSIQDWVLERAKITKPITMLLFSGGNPGMHLDNVLCQWVIYVS